MKDPVGVIIPKAEKLIVLYEPWTVQPEAPELPEPRDQELDVPELDEEDEDRPIDKRARSSNDRAPPEDRTGKKPKHEEDADDEASERELFS